MIPNDFPVIDNLYKTGHYDLTSHAGQSVFVDDAVKALHAKDPSWGHLRKSPGQTNIHGHAEDSALYLVDPDDGLCQSVDFISSAGTPNAKPAWQPDQPRYAPSDWMDPSDHGGATPTPVPPTPQPPAQPVYPSYEELGGDAGGAAITAQLEADYKRAQRAQGIPAGEEPGLDGGCGAWQQRVSYDFLTGRVPTVQASIDKHKASWCAALGIPVQ